MILFKLLNLLVNMLYASDSLAKRRGALSTDNHDRTQRFSIPLGHSPTRASAMSFQAVGRSVRARAGRLAAQRVAKTAVRGSRGLWASLRGLRGLWRRMLTVKTRVLVVRPDGRPRASRWRRRVAWPLPRRRAPSPCCRARSASTRGARMRMWRGRGRSAVSVLTRSLSCAASRRSSRPRAPSPPVRRPLLCVCVWVGGKRLTTY